MNPAADDQPTATLLGLPPELRNDIYQYVLPTCPGTDQPGLDVFAPTPPLLQVCSQIRSEAAGLYYQHTKFDLRVRICAKQQFQERLESLPKAALHHLLQNPDVSLRIVYDINCASFARASVYLPYYQRNLQSVTGHWIMCLELEKQIPEISDGVRYSRAARDRGTGGEELDRASLAAALAVRRVLLPHMSKQEVSLVERTERGEVLWGRLLEVGEQVRRMMQEIVDEGCIESEV